jgi:hypothetical protein
MIHKTLQTLYILVYVTDMAIVISPDQLHALEAGGNIEVTLPSSERETILEGDSIDRQDLDTLFCEGAAELLIHNPETDDTEVFPVSISNAPLTRRVTNADVNQALARATARSISRTS